MLTRRVFFALLFILAMTTSSVTPFASFKAKATVAPQEQVSLAGTWKGLIDAGGVKLHLVLKLKKSPDGGYTGVLNSPDQSGDLDLVVDTVVFKESTLRFEMTDLRAVYEGTLNTDGTEIVGHWKQGAAVPLIFRREDTVARPVKPLKRGNVKLEPCDLSNLTQAARCGKYEVFEDRAAARGRKIALNILILPASGDKPAPDPVFFLAGGPGQGAVSVASGAGDFLPVIRRERDIVFVDQRGTGGSNPLNCNALKDRDDMRSYFAVTSQFDSVRKCRTELEKVANLALYTTTIAMDDLDEVRGALGYDRINLYGGSYGTSAALVYMLTSTLPLMIHQAHEGDFAPFAAYAFLLIRQIEPQLATGMQLSVICAEHVPFITEGDIAREATGTYYGDAKIRDGQKICQEWPSVKAPVSFITPVKSDLPILLISGDIDPVTPSWVAAGATKLLPNALHVAIHNGTHLTQSQCIVDLISEFVSKGSARGLDTSCVNSIRRPPFKYEFPVSFKPAGK